MQVAERTLHSETMYKVICTLYRRGRDPRRPDAQAGGLLLQAGPLQRGEGRPAGWGHCQGPGARPGLQVGWVGTATGQWGTELKISFGIRYWAMGTFRNLYLVIFQRLQCRYLVKKKVPQKPSLGQKNALKSLQKALKGLSKGSKYRKTASSHPTFGIQ